MNNENEQLNNPLHGLKLDILLNELLAHYGFEIMAEYTNITCFKNRATIETSLKFLRKTEWAREKIERFYLYNYKNLPKADDTQYEITPRQRIIPAQKSPREPKVLIKGEAPAPKERSAKPFTRPNNSNNEKIHAKKSPNTKQNRQSKNEMADKSFNPYGDSPK